MNNNLVKTITILLPERLDSSNADKVRESILERIQDNPKGEIILDAAQLLYVSSAGLRVFLFFIKNYHVREMINVTSVVYEVLESTGFCRIMKTRRMLRRVDIEGLEEIGRGITGIVYRFGSEELVKVYKAGWTYEMVEKERDCAREMFVSGVDTAIAYDIVQVGDQFGVIFELINADSLTHVLFQYANDEQKIRELAREYALFVKKQHQIVMDPGAEELKQRVMEEVAADTDIIKAEYKEEFLKELEQIPETNTFLHGDFHPGNVMYKDGKFVLIDLGSAGVGHPSLDLAWIYFILKDNGNKYTDAIFGDGLSKITEQLMDTFLRTYYDTEDDEKIAAYKKALEVLGVARVIVMLKNGVPREIKEAVCRRIDEILQKELVEGVLRPLFE